MTKECFVLTAVLSWFPLQGQQAVQVQVPGIAQIALAGAPPGTTISGYPDAAPLNSPVLVGVPMAAGEGIQIQATGTVGTSGSTPNISPDGGTSVVTTYTVYNGAISAIRGPVGGLVGVFVGDSLNANNRPSDVDFSGAAKDIALLTPMLQQPFFIGSGKASDGTLKTYVAPTGATRLFLGVLNSLTYSDTGSFSATTNIVAIPKSPGNLVRVYGVSQITLAGAPPGTTISGYPDTASLDSPVLVGVPMAAGEAIQIQATGTVGTSGSTPNISPDGGTSVVTTYTVYNGAISAIRGPVGSLVGVFVGDSLNANNRPSDVDFSGAAKDIALLTPMLQQPFFIGSGKASDGTLKTYVAPTGATRLFLGVLNSLTYSNTGSFSATTNIVAIPDLPSNPVRVYGVNQITLAGAVPGTTISGYSDTAPLDSPTRVQVPLTPGQSLRILGTGTVGTSGGTPNLPPDGGTSIVTTYTVYNGAISAIRGPVGGLVGVFAGDALNANNRPPDVDFSSSAARDVAKFTPLLQQPFFIGSGTTSTGTLKSFVVPSGATRLFLGVLNSLLATGTGSFIAAVSPDTQATPVLTLPGITNAAGFGSNPVAPGSLAALFGSSLASSTVGATDVPLPTTLADTKVYFDLIAAPLFFVSSGQVNVQVPFEINADHVQVVVSRGGAASLPVSLSISPYAPGIFVAGDGTPIIVNYRTGGLVGSNQPAKVGDVLIIYATGLGPVSSPPSSGIPASLDTLSTLRVAATVTIGSVSASPIFAGLAPGFIGLYQVNVTVPQGVPQGNTTLQVSVVGASSNKVPITIGH